MVVSTARALSSASVRPVPAVRSTTLPMEVFSAVRLGVKPEINAVASLILLAVSLVTFMVWFFSRRAEEHRKKAIQQAIDESAAESWKQPDVRRPQSTSAV